MRRLCWCQQFTFALIVLLLACCACAEDIVAPERVLWNKRPIPVHIQRDHERIIHFPDDIRYWLPDVLKNKVAAMAANGVLYLRALDVFPPTRIRVQGLVDQQVYLLDVLADTAEAVSDELIIMTAATVSNRAKAQLPVQSPVDWRVRLTRYAAQQLYAPERVLTGDSQIQRVPLDALGSIPIVKGQRIAATPIAAWQGGGLTVTAVKLRNITAQPLRLVFDGQAGSNVVDLAADLRGNWLTASFQHNTLGALGNVEDTTTLYLVSKRSFIESVGLIAKPKAVAGEVEGG